MTSCASIYRTWPLVPYSGTSSSSVKGMELLRNEGKYCHAKGSATAPNFQENKKKNRKVDSSVGRGSPGLLIVSFILLMQFFLNHIHQFSVNSALNSKQMREVHYVQFCSIYSMHYLYFYFQNINYLHYATFFHLH